MKILIVCTTDSMIENFLVPHIKYLEERGHSVECVCSETGVFFKNLIDIGIKLHKIQFTRFPFSIKNLKAYFLLSKYVSDNKIDLIFCHEPVGGVMGRLVGSRFGLKVIYMAHGFHFYKGAPWIYNHFFYWIEKVLSIKTDLLITINNEDFDASKQFYAKKIVKINGIGVDTNRFVYNPNSFLRNKYNLEKNCIILLSVGELSKRKNHEVILRAICKINSNIHYFIVGEGELLMYLKDLSKSLGISDKVSFLGFRRDIDLLCNACDIFLLPSIQEGLSLALMEAMGCGKPIIASKIRGNTDLIEDGSSGYLIPHNDIDGFSDAIRNLVTNPNLREVMGTHNREKIKDFDLNIIIEQLTKLIENL